MRGLRLFGLLVLAWVALLAAVVAAGFLYQAVGVWATVIWSLILVGAVALEIQRRVQFQP